LALAVWIRLYKFALALVSTSPMLRQTKLEFS